MDEINYDLMKLVHVNILENAYSILLKYLQQVNMLFTPTLDSYMHIDDYAKKILSKAYVCLLSDDSNNYFGHYAIYLNDIESKVAFLTSIAVLKKYEGKGLAQILLTDAINKAQQKGMNWFRLETNTSNHRAIFFYKKNGFLKESVDSDLKDSSFFMKKRISL